MDTRFALPLEGDRRELYLSGKRTQAWVDIFQRCARPASIDRK